MRDRLRLRDRYDRVARWLRRTRRRASRTVHRRLEETRTIVHVSILVFVPLLVALLTYLSNRIDQLSFFLFPPLAAGTYALFANPESEYASPLRFVAGLTAGAVCAAVAMQVAVRVVYPDLPPTAIEVDAPGAAFAVFLTGAVTWALDVEEAAAFSTALLGLLVDPGRQVSFVLSVVLSASVVAGIFAVWRDLFYEQRARYLYQSIRGDDRVLVPVRGDAPAATAMLGARLAAAHDAGKVVLLDIVDEAPAEEDDGAEELADATTAPTVDASPRADVGAGSETGAETGVEAGRKGNAEKEGAGDPGAAAAEAEAEAEDDSVEEVVAATAADLESLGARIESELQVPCQVVVAASDGSDARVVRQTARETNCDLVATPYETDEDGQLAPFVAQLLDARRDVFVHESDGGRTDWRRVVVPVRRASDTAHAMIDFARRLVGPDGRVSVAHCIDSEDQRRRADRMLANLVETTDGRVETRVANAPIEEFVRRVARTDDLVIVGASRDRSRASRLVSPPTFERLDDVNTDVAVVARR